MVLAILVMGLHLIVVYLAKLHFKRGFTMLKNKHVSAYKDIIIMLIAIVLIVYLAQ
jgi:hypothetical protein